jgi:hypothetical protein
MAKTVIGLMENPRQAEDVARELMQNGFDRADIGLIARDVRSEGETVFKGSLIGMSLGALTGLLMAVTAFAVPGLGPVLVAGPLAGSAVGALVGGIAAGLMSHGVPEDEAHFFAEGVRRGGALLTVNARTDELVVRAVEIMKRHGAMGIHERAAEWRQKGWSGRSGLEPASTAH